MDRSKEFDHILKAELAQIQKRIGKQDKRADNLVGLAFAGGGIRSASFCMGIIQALAQKDRLKEIDYLSTVSGGGFIGSALTWYLFQHKSKGEEVLGSNGFSLYGQFKDSFNFSREHQNYLFPGKGLNIFSLVSSALRGTLLYLLVYFPFICLLMYGVRPWENGEYLIDAMVLVLGFFALTTAFYSIATYVSTKVSASSFVYRFRTSLQKWLGRSLKILVALIILWTLKIVTLALFPHGFGAISGSVATLIGYLGIGYNVIKNFNTGKDLFSSLIHQFSPILFIYGLLLLGCVVAQFYPKEMGYMLGAALFLGIFTNLNLIGIHRIYQDRLMETFMPNHKEAKQNKWGLATQSNIATLHAMLTQTVGPYPIYCATVSLMNATEAKYKNRGGDSFILSPLYCGSEATGWQKSTDFMNGTMNLPTAMAISGAAINPGIGMGSNPWTSFLMMIMNVRLGYWAPNPNHKFAAKHSLNPNLFLPGLSDLLSTGYHESSPYCELTDGGNFEDTGVYELIRRKVKVIICCEAGQDEEFGSLAQAIELVRLDFGVEIAFDDPEYDGTGMIPGSAASGFLTEKCNLARSGFSAGTICYPEDQGKPSGRIYYIKASMISNLPIDLYGFELRNSPFPYTTTSEQSYTERQYESFRELGFCQAQDLLSYIDENWNKI